MSRAPTSTTCTMMSIASVAIEAPEPDSRAIGKPAVSEPREVRKLSPKAAELLAILAYPVKKQQEVDKILAELR